MSIREVPMLDLVEQYRPLRQALQDALGDALDSGQFILGPQVRELESELAARVGVRHAIACASGSDALLLALMALDIGPGDAVVTTPYSFFSTVSSITRLGARPLLVDIEPDTYNLDLAAVRRLIERDCVRENGQVIHRKTRARVRALLPVHLYGQCADLTAASDLAAEYGLAIAEDAAQALGAKWAGANAGAVGAVGCFSFYPAKNLGALGDGGLMTTDDDRLAEKLRKLRVHGAKPKYVHQFVGINSRLDAIQAAFLRVMLPHLSEWEARRRQHAEAYTEALAGHPTLRAPVVRPEAHHVFNQYVVRTPERDVLKDFLTSKGVATEVYYPVPLHLQECFAFLGYAAGDFPESERASRETLALPVGPTLTREAQAYVIAAIREVLS